MASKSSWANNFESEFAVLCEVSIGLFDVIPFNFAYGCFMLRPSRLAAPENKTHFNLVASPNYSFYNGVNDSLSL